MRLIEQADVKTQILQKLRSDVVDVSQGQVRADAPPSTALKMHRIILSFTLSQDRFRKQSSSAYPTSLRWRAVNCSHILII